MNAREYWKVIRRKWPVMVACALAAAVVMFLVTPAEPPPVERVKSYDATATLLISTPSTSPDSVGGGVSLDRMALYIQSGEIPQKAAEQLGETENPALLANRVTIEPNHGAMSMTLSMNGSDPQRTADVVNAFAEQTVAYFQTPRDGTGSATVEILQEATPIPVIASGGFSIPPSRTFRTIMAALLGLLIGFGLALVLHQVDSRLRTRDEVYEAVRMPVIAEVPKLPRQQRENSSILAADEPHGTYADGYRTARAAIMHTASRFLPEDQFATFDADGRGTRSARVVLVTSASAAEGKTTSIANLAATFAETGQSVLVLDADLRSPDLHLRFDVPQGAGISDFLYDPAATRLEALARPTSVAGVRIITAGTQLAHPASLATRMGTLVEEARKIADVILVDAAPLLAASDVFDLLPIVDTVVFVVRSGRLTESAAHRASELLGRFHVPVAGAILIGTSGGRGYGYGYGYGYGSAAEDPAANHKRVHLKQRRRRGSSRDRVSGRRSEHPRRPTAPVSEQESQRPAYPVEVTRADIRNAELPTRRSRSRADAAMDQEFDPYAGYQPERDQT